MPKVKIIENCDYANSYIGRKIKILRNIADMTQTDLAKKCDITYQQIQKYELGYCRITVARILELAKIFNVKVSYFFEGLEDEIAEEKGQNE